MYCWKCGTENNDNAKFCMKCGENIVVDDSEQSDDSVNENVKKESSSPEVSSTPQNSNFNTNSGAISSRNIVACVLFSIITCGIYTLYWIYKINQEINIITGHEDDTSGGLVILFGIISCGIYYVYWAYKIGDKLKGYYNKKNSSAGNDLPVLYLILMIANYIACGICTMICYCLIQDRINKIVEGK